MTTEELYQIYLHHPSVQTDTRKLMKDDIFFALKGENFNGNNFALDALEKGAAFAVVDEDSDKIDNRLIRVENVLETLQNLAKYHREQFKILFIAVTGSNGKTTTKELMHAVLSSQYKTYTTQGNLNNHIGIPLTILKIKPDAEIAIIEMGANHTKEIEGYCRYAQPTHGIITNCGKAHLEGFGSIEGVRKGKGELYDYLKATKGIAFVNDDYDYLHSMSKGIETIVWYGITNGLVTGNVVASAPFLEIVLKNGFAEQRLQTKLVGDYNLSNVLCAATAGKYFKVPDERILESIENYSPSNSRSQLIEWNNNKVILDAYNANPASMRAAIQNFAAIESDKKILIIGAMAEMGKESSKEHQNIIELINAYKWEHVALVGPDFNSVKNSYLNFNTSAEAKNWLQKQQFKDAYLLIKGSRSMQMEKVLY